MNKGIAQQLWNYASSQQRRECAIWYAMPDRTPADKWEAQRLVVAEWATAANEIYRLWLKPEPQPIKIKEGITHA